MILEQLHRFSINMMYSVLTMTAGVGLMGTICTSVRASEASTESLTQLNAELQRISPKRTLLTIDFRDRATISTGTKVTVTAGETSLKGAVKKISSKGRAIVKLQTALPKSVETGSVLVSINEIGSSNEMVKIEGDEKSNLFRDPGFLVGYTSTGFSGLAEISLMPQTGKLKVTGGSANEKVDFAATRRDAEVDARGRYRIGPFGAGVQLNYLNNTFEAKASIDTVSTGTKDSDSINEKSSGYRATPNIVFVTESGIFAAGLGWRVGSLTSERPVKIAGIAAPHNPVKTSESGLALELSTKISSLKVGISALLSGKGKIKESEKADIERKFSSYGINFQTNLAGIDHRFAFDQSKIDDKYSLGNLTNSKMGLDWQTQIGLNSLSLVPRFAIDWGNVSYNDRKGKSMNLAMGSRVSFGGPFAGIEFRYGTESENATGNKPSQKTTMYGAAISGGITF